MAKVKLVKTTTSDSLGTPRRIKSYVGFSTVNRDFDSNTLYDYELARTDLLNAFYIKKGEKLEVPDYGTVVWDLLFEPFTPITQTLVRNRIETVLENYEPRVTVTSVDIVDPEFQHMDNNSLNISINFTLKNDPNIQAVDILLERIR